MFVMSELKEAEEVEVAISNNVQERKGGKVKKLGGEALGRSKLFIYRVNNEF